MIYFIGPEWPNLVKIGHADNVRDRLGMLQVYCPLELRVYGVQDGSEPEEAELHVFFRPLWHRGEWYRHEDPIRAHIREKCRPWHPDEEPRRPRTQLYHKSAQFYVTCRPEFHAYWTRLAAARSRTPAELAMTACEAYAITRGFGPAPKRPRSVQPPTNLDRTPEAVRIRSNTEWVAWLAGFARAEKTTVSHLVRLAIEVSEKSTDNPLDVVGTAN